MPTNESVGNKINGWERGRERESERERERESERELSLIHNSEHTRPP